MGTAQSPSPLAAGAVSDVANRWKYARFVNRPMSRTSASATKALMTPTAAAINVRRMVRRSVL